MAPEAEAEADSGGTPSQPIIYSPQSPPSVAKNDNDDIITAIVIAQIRITSAQKWYESSLVMFERAKAQVELSQRELKDATDYLERLNSLSSSSSSLAVAKGINSTDVAKEGEEEDINLMSSLSEESVDKLELKKSTSSGGTEQTATSETVVSENNNVAAVAVNQGSSSTEISSGEEEERNYNKPFKNLPVGGVVGSENDVAKSISTNTEGDVSTEYKQPSMQVEEEIVSLAAATAVCDSYNTLFNEDELSQTKETESKSADAALYPLSPLSIVSSDSVDSEDKKDDDKVLLDTSNRDEEVDIYLENDTKEIPTVSPLRKKDILNRAQSDEEFLSVLSETSDKTFEEDNTDANADIDTSFQKIIRTIPECNEVYLMGCDGIPELNGRYSKFAISDDVPTYSKIAKLDGQEVICTISRWQANNGTRKWYVTATVPGGGDKAKHVAFYVTYAPVFLNRPPRKSWMKCVDGEELFLSPEYSMRGVDPPPIISIESEDGNGLRSGPGLLGRQISTALKSGSSIVSSGSSNSSSKRRRRKEQQEKKSLGSLGSSVSTSKSAKNADEVPSSVYLPPSLLR